MLKRDREILITLCIFLAGVIYYLSYFNSGFAHPDVDEPWLANGAVDVLKGRLPAIDFASNYPPGRFYLLALLFRLFGPSLVVERLAWVPFLALAPVLAYRSGRRLMPVAFALLPATMVLLVPGAWWKTLISLVSILNLLAIYRYFERRTKERLFICGLTLGLSAAFQHDVAGFAALAFLITLALERIFFPGTKLPTLREALRGLAVYLLGATLTLLPFVVPYLLRSAADDLVSGLFQRVVVMSGYSQRYQFPDPLLVLNSTIAPDERFSILLIYTPPLVALLTLLLLLWRTKGRSKEHTQRNVFVFLALLLLIFGYNQVVIVKLPSRVLQGGGITYLLIGYLVFEGYTFFANLWPQRVPLPGFRWLLLGGGLFLLLLFPAYFVYFHLRSPDYCVGTIGMRQGKQVLLEGQRGGIYANVEDGLVINSLVRFVEETTSPQEKVWIAIHLDEVVYFLTGRERLPYNRWDTPLGDPDRRLPMLRDDNPDLILLRETDLFGLLLRPELSDDHEYVIQNHHYEQKIGPYLVLRRGSNDVSLHLFHGMETFARLRFQRLSPEESVWLSAVADLEVAVRGGIKDEYTSSLLARAYIALADIYRVHGQAEEAIQEFEKALAVEARIDQEAWVHLHLGKAYQMNGQMEKAIREYERVLELEPGNAKAQKALASLHRALGDAYRAARRWEEAAGEYEKALALQPQLDQSARVHLCLGKAYREAGRREEAIREYERVLELEPGNVAAQKALASLRQ